MRRKSILMLVTLATMSIGIAGCNGNNSSSESPTSTSTGPAPVAHAITVDPEVTNVTITPSVTTAIAGTTVNVSVTYDEDLDFVGLTSNVASVEFKTTNALETYTFVMPDQDIQIGAEAYQMYAASLKVKLISSVDFINVDTTFL